MAFSCPIDELELESVLAGEAAPEIEAHVRDCDVCHNQLKRLARDELPFRQLLFRATCPSPQELAEWHLGWLDSDDASRISRHLDMCARCRMDVQIQAGILDLPIDDPLEADDVPRIVADAVSLSPDKTTALRGSSPLHSLSPSTGQHYKAENVIVSLDIQPESSLRRRLNGLICNDVAKIGQFDGATILLKRSQQEVDRVHVDDVDTFSFVDVPQDVYTMELHLSSIVVVIEQLDV